MPSDDSSQESRDFGAILADFEREQAGGAGEDPKPGEKVTGKIVGFGEESAFLDLGGKSDGMVRLVELCDDEGKLHAEVGDTVSGLVSGRDRDSGCLVVSVRPGAGGGDGSGRPDPSLVREAHAHGLPVEGVVREVVKGGVEVDVGGVRAFCPVSQLDTRYVEDPAEFSGRRLTFRVARFEESGRGGRPNVVLSRRSLLEEEERERAKATLERLEEGAVVTGTVSSVVGYGAFVDLGGVEGLLHVSEMAWERIEAPEEVLSPGDRVEVKVLKVEPSAEEGGTPRISLSSRALQLDPWQEAEAHFAPGTTTRGRVTRLAAFGAFVELAPGLEGLLHVSEMGAGRRIAHPREVLTPGREIAVRVLAVDPDKRRLSLAAAERLDGGESPDEAAPADLEAYLGRGEGDAPEEKGGEGFGAMADFFRKAKLDS